MHISSQIATHYLIHSSINEIGPFIFIWQDRRRVDIKVISVSEEVKEFSSDFMGHPHTGISVVFVVLSTMEMLDYILA